MTNVVGAGGNHDTKQSGQKMHAADREAVGSMWQMAEPALN